MNRMSLFAGSVYSSPGVLQGGLGGAPPVPKEEYSTLSVSTIFVADQTEVEVPGNAIASANLSTLRLSTDILSTLQIVGTSIAGYGSSPVISMPDVNIANISGIVTRAISGVTAINAPITFPTETALTNVLSMTVSSINGSRPITYMIDVSGDNTETGFSTFSTSIMTIENLDPTSMYNVTYTSQITDAVLTNLGSNLNVDYPIFFTCESGVGTQFSSSGIRMVKDMCEGAASTFVVADTFTMYPLLNSTIVLGYGAAVPYDATNELTIAHTLVLLTKLGIQAPT